MNPPPTPDEEKRAPEDDAESASSQPRTNQLGPTKVESWIREQQRMLEELREEAETGRLPVPEGHIGVQILGKGEPLILPLETEIVLGRFDVAHHDGKHLDLTPYNAYALGVSREHAAIRRQGDSVVVVDLDSTNGTWLNGVQLASGQTPPLHDGDEIVIGELMITVYF